MPTLAASSVTLIFVAACSSACSFATRAVSAKISHSSCAFSAASTRASASALT